jgi:hypothetical protein
MKRFLFVTSMLLVVLVVFASMASATVVNVASWRGGENDVSPGPTGTIDAADTTAVDGTGNGHNLTNAGPSVFYAYPSNYPAGVGLPSGSTVDYAWAPGSWGFTSTTPVATGAQNWGVQLWVRPNSLGKMDYLMNGDAGAFNDITLFQLDASLLGWGTGVHYFCEIGGAGFLGMGGEVDLDHWHNLALVNDAGTATFYVDGNAVSSWAGPDNAGLSAVTPGAFLGLGVGSDGVGGMTGGIDEARIFTFAPGAFHVSDLGLATPEPGTLVLLTTGLFGLLAYAWRKRK